MTTPRLFPRTRTSTLLGALLWLALAALVLIPPAHAVTLFADGFEGIEDYDDLFPANLTRWTNAQLTYESNYFDINTSVKHAGAAAMEFYAVAPSGPVSKASLEREGFDLQPSATVIVSAWLYIPSGQSLSNLFLFDLECSTCYSTGPGIRLVLEQTAGYLAVERGKLGYTQSFKQPQGQEVAFPRNAWVYVQWAMVLSTGTDGETEVWMNSNKLIDASGINMPNPAFFLSEYSITLPNPVKYNRLQVGITANATPGEVVLVLDDVAVTQ